MFTRRIFLALSLSASILSSTALAAGPRKPLSEADKADIARIETYLGDVKTMRARFQQYAPNGNVAEGDAFFHRPGRMRLQYDPPSPVLVVADGSFLIIHDKELGEPSYIPLNSTPAGVLVRDKVKLNGPDVTTLRVTRSPGVLSATVVDADDPGQGELTLVFSDSPLALRQWRVLDAQGNLTTVSLYDIKTGIALDDKLFEFRDPKYVKPKLNDG